MAGRAPFLPKKISRYIHQHAVREPPILRELRAATASLPNAGMQIGADQGQFMALLVQAIGARNCLEIGTFTGYSALAVALALPDDGRIVCCDLSEEWTAIGKPFWKKAGVETKIDLRIGPALRTLDEITKEKRIFDFVFIDADKTNYQNYFNACLPIVRRRGIIAVDNTLWSGWVADRNHDDADTTALRKFNDKLHHDERVEIALLPLGDGVTLALKK
ncbi:MAG TPA: class I SAM-dependent methyltransferase [Burkholderiales bacterium]|jgi:caffeoyl-CoA O-methyltransferase|nr:class I SAM-dependent methyltransferase [Burkholderiales bacterium]